MILENLVIARRNSWENGIGDFRGTLRIKGANGTIELAVDDEVSKRILAVVADSLVIAAKDIAQNLTAEVFTQPSLESK